MSFRWIAMLAFLGALVLSISGAAQKVSIGIAPVFDGGGEEYGPTVAQHLTLFTYQDLLDSSTIHPTLLGPGGVYSPLDTSWLVEYVQDRTDLNLLLVATLKAVTNPSREKWIIPVEVQVLNARSGDTVTSFTVTTEINSHKTLLEFGQVALAQGTSRYGDVKGDYKTYIGTPSRDFEKQPLGKATADLSRSIRKQLEAKLSDPAVAKVAQANLVPAAQVTSASCPVNIHITYNYKHSASHSYVLLANGMDQSTNLKDGVASFSAPEGELLMQFSVNDAPYKLQKESLYQLSVVHSCKSSNLVVDLGAGGDAHTHWE